MTKTVVPFRYMSKPAFQKRMRELAESAQVGFVSHATKRLKERGFTPADVIKCLLRGTIVEGPARNIKGNEQATIELFLCGEEIKVAVVIEGDALVVITVMD